MRELNFYTVDPGYIRELQEIDPKVPNIQYETHDKFACGVFFEIAGHEYFAPISSFKKQQKTNVQSARPAHQVESAARV